MNKETSEIAKLTERISKDPRSKLFVPLAEEYKKAGDIEMAVHVLTEGLKTNPGYITARSLLGKLLFEKGDLPGAQKELEEVVKAIPDSLMAQRKLADVYALQDRAAEGLKHYKIALSLNPKDQETAMLISEAEAGRDIKKFLAQKTPGPQQKDQGQPLKTAAISGVGRPPASGVKMQTGAGVAEEEAEEIFVVEPLDPVAPLADIAAPVQKTAPGEFDFLSEPVQDAGPADGQEPLTPDAPFTFQEEASTGAELSAVETEEATAAVTSENGPFRLSDPDMLQMTESAGLDLLTGDLGPAEGPAAPEAPEKQGDDFTTDTLAELYISQGFYEKAVDIYERMLADNPNSQGLKDKLATVRAMAAAASPEPTPSQVSSFAVDSTFDADGEPAGATAPETNTEQDAFSSPVLGQPRLDEWELPEATVVPSLDLDGAPAAQVKQARQPDHFDTGFEPREYVPPDAVLRDPEAETADAGPIEHGIPRATTGKQPFKTSGPTPVRTPDARRKETVDRLEGWLKNIIKEK